MLKPNVELDVNEVIKQGVNARAVKLTAPFKMISFTVAPECQTQADQHQVEEIWMIQSGEGMLCFEENLFPVKAGEIIHFPPFTRHQITNHKSDELQIISIYW